MAKSPDTFQKQTQTSGTTELVSFYKELSEYEISDRVLNNFIAILEEAGSEEEALSETISNTVSSCNTYSKDIYDVCRLIVFSIVTKGKKDKKSLSIQPQQIEKMEKLILCHVRSETNNDIRFAWNLYSIYLIEVRDYDMDDDFNNALIRQLIRNLHRGDLERTCMDFLAYIFHTVGETEQLSREDESSLYSCCVTHLRLDWERCPSALFLIGALQPRVNRITDQRLYYQHIQNKIQKFYENSIGFEKYLWFRAWMHSAPLDDWKNRVERESEGIIVGIMKHPSFEKEVQEGIYKLSFFMDPLIPFLASMRLDFYQYLATISCCATIRTDSALCGDAILGSLVIREKNGVFEHSVDPEKVFLETVDKKTIQIRFPFNYECKSYEQAKSLVHSKNIELLICLCDKVHKTNNIELIDISLDMLKPGTLKKSRS